MIQMIPIDKIMPHPGNPRKELGDISELAESIKARGILQNLTVVKGHRLSDEEWKELSAAYRENPIEDVRKVLNSRYTKEGYTAIIGHRRLAAARAAGLREVPCTIAEMDEREQLETMLLENVQRADLTMYEQAQGFKSLFDMGASVASISERTGFGETTIRRRLKMAELNAEKFREACKRQIKIEDLDMLFKVEDIKKRDKLLCDIGTNNFDWNVKKAIAEQETEKRRGPLLKIVSSFAEKIDEKEAFSNKYEYETRYEISGTLPEDIKKPEDGKERFYRESNGDIVIYRKAERKKAEVSKEEAERKERVNRLNKVAAAAYERRFQYVKSFSAYNKQETAMRFAVEALLIERGSSVSAIRELFDICGVKEDEKTWKELTDEEKARINACGKADALILISYAEMGDNKKLCAHNSYDGAYSEYGSGRLKAIYKALKIIGYEASDEERAYTEGTHELYEAQEMSAAGGR